ncbi:MAG TPA: HAD family phosphatase, partial [Ferruginibacter sp.]|nr:HAD family phosphatase [Ferruginibacter sp.]
MATIKNIIFDLGGVLLDIDTGRTNEAFAKLGVIGFQNQYTLQKADPLFDELEKGHIEEAAFYEAIRQKTGLQLLDQEIRDAWNALILEFRTESIERLSSLKEQYNIYLLSNT